VYRRALIRILLLQLSQTFDSTILVLIIVVRLHSNAYMRSLTLFHKMRGVKMCSVSTIWRKMCSVSFFLDYFTELYSHFTHNLISHLDLGYSQCSHDTVYRISLKYEMKF